MPVTTTILQKLFAHWQDYLAALEAYPQFRIIKAEIDQLQTVYSPETLQAYQTAYQRWLLAGAEELSATYNDKQVRLVEGWTTATHAQANESRARLLDAWIRKETQDHGHWGDQTPYRITVGGHDEGGSLGFSQIKNWFKYGDPNGPDGKRKVAELQSVNLYHPEGAIKGFALWANLSNGGESFYRAFDPNCPTEKTFTASKLYPVGIYPRLSNSNSTENIYTDSAYDIDYQRELVLIIRGY